MTTPVTHLATLLLLALPALGETKAILDIKKAPPQGETLVWSPLFQASWDKLNAIHGGLPEKVEPPNQLITQLDQFKWKADEVMPKDGYAIFAGPASPEFAQATATQIKNKFGVEMTPSKLPKIPGGKALYGILLRDLSFQKAFFRSQKKPLKFKGSTGKTHRVSFFGTTGRLSGRYGESVKVIAYKQKQESFILKIATDRDDETLIIYQPEIPQSFEKAIEQVKAALKAPLDGPYGSITDDTLHRNDTVKIPYLHLNATTLFTSQLQGLRFYPKEKQPWQIEMAYQFTKFELFEKGARIRVETGTAEDAFGSPAPSPRRINYVPRNFICNKPFFVFAWREDAQWPYFSAWIDGKAALKPFTRR